MDKIKRISELIDETEKISEVEKCLSCQCFYDTLMEFRELLKKEKRDKDVEKRLSRVIQKTMVTHDCLGCDPCYPVSVSNALSELAGSSSTCSCGPVCQPMPGRIIVPAIEKIPSWPIEQGEYIVGNKASPVAITSLGSDKLPEVISRKLGRDRFVLVGKTHTENIGIEKIVKNTISNSHIRFIILCGKDTRGHMAGQSLLSLFQNGVSQEKRIIGFKGQRPILKNLSLTEIQHFREQVTVVDLTGAEDANIIETEVKQCMEKNPGRFERSLDVRTAPVVEAGRPGKLALDPSGFFIIYPKKEEGRIYVEHYKADGTLNEVIYGEDPVVIASTAIERGLVSRLDHAAYLGREIEKAYLSIVHGFPYFQDSAPGKEEEDKGTKRVDFRWFIYTRKEYVMGKWSCWLAALTLLTQPAFAELRSGTKAPDFRLEALTGGAVMLTIQKEKLVITVTQTEKEDKVVQRNAKVALLHFFQPTWQVCQKEMVHLQKLHEKYDMQGAAVLGVSLSPMEAVTKQVVGRLKLTYTMLKGADSPDVNKWDTRSWPVYVVDAGGVIQFSQVGFTEGDEKKWEQTIKTLLN